MTMNQTPLKNLIGASWVDGTGTATDVVDPSTGETCARIREAGQELVDQAVASARKAFGAWRQTTEFDRRALLRQLAGLVRRDLEPLAQDITREMGKPIGESRGEVSKLAEAFEYYAEEAVRVYGRTIPNEARNVTSIVRYEPIGVVAAISPWNYPLELIGWKLAASLAAGCTMVLKPSEYTPTSAVRLFGLLAEVGLPSGVANLILGAGTTGGQLTSHPGIDKVAFTGSGRTGAAITRGLAHALPVSMELGGSCPQIVTATANIDDAVAGCLRRGFRNAGQICIAINRVYVARAVHAEFVEKLAAAVVGLSVGPGTEDPDVGPVTNAEIQDRFLDHIADARDNGGTVVVGGTAIDRPGTWVQPAVVDNVNDQCLIATEETFGPVVGVTAFDDNDEAVELANGTTAGLAAYLYATDVSEIFEMGHRLDFGNVAVNNPDAGIMNAPYGGRKGSGHGYEHGPEGLHAYLNIKHLRIRY
ncbi:aldehyde dehydrogenase [Citricoccus sp. K5]|uniref:aldehyde dehydrogenase family protein n=1 Tax=Citricoccus sp. K5 TaxID=2653135 RepID=UPI0012F07267|nr:aldehyde dehydrogenase family protein [Citricoccus sp. K5]VXB65450.1 Succinate-semialdehyde dehydrogenase (NADP(+)) GabD [Citricoccus sp. K5]